MEAAVQLLVHAVVVCIPAGGVLAVVVHKPVVDALAVLVHKPVVEVCAPEAVVHIPVVSVVVAQTLVVVALVADNALVLEAVSVDAPALVLLLVEVE